MKVDEVTYNKKKILKILRDLNLLVVAIDRIGSASYADFDEGEYNAMFVRFFDECGFAKKISSARDMLSESFSDVLGEDGMDELERNSKDLKYWGDE